MSTKRSTCLFAGAPALAYPWLTLAQQTQPPAAPPWGPWGGPGPMHMWQGGWGFGWMLPIFMLIVCIVIFLIGYRIGAGHRHGGPWHAMDRPYGHGGARGDHSHSALVILGERFAKGEIKKEEYEDKRATILSDGSR